MIALDTQELSFSKTTKFLVPGSGRWPVYKNIRQDFREKYFPNKYIHAIRASYPPDPQIVAWLAGTGRAQTLHVIVRNNGQTMLEEFSVQAVNQNRHEGTKSIAVLAPKKQREFSIPLERAINSQNLQLVFQERYGFSLPNQSF